jgi:hypothetical protein
MEALVGGGARGGGVRERKVAAAVVARNLGSLPASSSEKFAQDLAARSPSRALSNIYPWAFVGAGEVISRPYK